MKSMHHKPKLVTSRTFDQWKFYHHIAFTLVFRWSHLAFQIARAPPLINKTIIQPCIIHQASVGHLKCIDQPSFYANGWCERWSKNHLPHYCLPLHSQQSYQLYLKLWLIHLHQLWYIFNPHSVSANPHNPEFLNDCKCFEIQSHVHGRLGYSTQLGHLHNTHKSLKNVSLKVWLWVKTH
jgi:hypothetical protein